MPGDADEILSLRVLFQGWLKFLLVSARLGGQYVERPLIEHPSGSSVLAYDAERRVAFTVRQTRLPVLHLRHSALPEGVAGVGEDESAEDTARREAKEEIGVTLRTLEPVGFVWMTPSTTTERVRLFLAEYSVGNRLEAGGGADGELEDLDIREEPLTALWLSASSGQLADAKLFMLLQALHLRRPELFA